MISTIFISRKNYFLKIEPYLLINKPLLQILVNFMLRKELIHDVEDIVEKSGIAGEFFTGFRQHYQDTELYNKIEDQLIEKYRLIPKYRLMNDYSYAYSLLTSRYIVELIRLISKIEFINSKNSIDDLCGVDKDFIIIYNMIYTKKPNYKINKKINISIFTNIVNCFSGILKSFLFSIKRLRFKKIKQENFLLGADVFNDQKPDDDNTYLLKNIVDKTEDLLFVFRGESGKKIGKKLFKNVRTCTINDGQVNVFSFYKVIFSITKDTFLLFRTLIFKSTTHFSLFWILIYENVRHKIFFERFNTKYFFGRDEYSFVSHIRTFELRKRNNLSLGLMHGYPPNGTKLNLKYIDFDIYYVFGDLFRELYKKTWPDNMLVKSIGSWRLRKEYKIGTNVNRPKDIIYFNSESVKQNYITNEIIKLANFYQDRFVYFKPKSNSGRISYWKNHFKQFSEIPKNIVIEYGNDPFKFMQKSSYAISHNSTVLLESINFGLITFDFDVDKDIKNYTTRGFHDLCVDSSDDIIERISKYESGDKNYNNKIYVNLINVEVSDPYSLIKKDIYN